MSEINKDYNAAEENLEDWKTPPSLRELDTLVSDAKIEHDRHLLNVARWEENFNITGKAKIPVRKGRSSIAPKLIRKQAEWRYPALTEPFLSTPDLFNISPQSAGDRKRAIQNQLVLNNQFNTKLNKVHFIDQYIRTAVDTGTVVIKVTWETEEAEITEVVPVYEYIALDPQTQPQEFQETAQYYMQLVQLAQADSEEYANISTPGLDTALQLFTEQQQVVIPNQVGEEEITTLKEIKNQPLLEICDINNIVVSPASNGDYTKAGFVVEYSVTCLSDLKKDGRYTNLDKINIEGASPLSSEDYTGSKDNETFNFSDNARKQFVIKTYWGEWDIDGTGVTKPIVCSWVGNVKIREELNPYPDRKPPFVVIPYMPVRNSIYGEPDGELLEDNQKIIGAITRGMIDLLGRSANSQTAMRKDMLDVTNLRKYQRGDDYEVNAMVDPKQGIYTHTYPEIPQSAYNMLTMQNNEAESISGIKAFHAGISGQALGQTATAVRSALDATSKRELGILRRLADGIITIGKKIIAMNALFLSEEEVIRITAKEFVTIRRDDLAGNFDLTLSISTAEEDNQKAQELAFILQTMNKDTDPGLYKMILSDIATLRKMPDIAKKIEDYEPQPDPMVQMEQELKIHLLKAQIAKEEALTAKHQAEAGLSQARSQKEMTQAELNLNKGNTEQAKTRQLVSSADRQNLDYLEQESGVHQERELQKIRAKMEKRTSPTTSASLVPDSGSELDMP